MFATGYLDEVRISKTARWTSDFTPPVEPYTLSNSGGVGSVVTTVVSAINSAITAVNAIIDDGTNLFLGTDQGVEMLTLDTLTRDPTATDTYLAKSDGQYNVLAGDSSYITALSYNSIFDQLAVGTQGTDRGDIFTELLLHSNTYDGDTTITDSSMNEYFIVNHGVSHSTDTQRFGSSSIYFNGGSYLELDDISAWNIAGDDFTVDFWMKPSEIHTYLGTMFGATENNAAHTGFVVDVIDDGGIDKVLAKFSNSDISGGSPDVALSADITDLFSANSWMHVAVVRSGDAWKLYIDGEAKDSVTSSFALSETNRKLTLGAIEVTGDYYTGYLDEVRFSRGIARWTSNFVPSAEPYGLAGALSIVSSLHTPPVLDYGFDAQTASAAGLSSSNITALDWGDHDAVPTFDLLVGTTGGFNLLGGLEGSTNTAPNAPTLISPADGNYYINSFTPTLSSQYTDLDAADTGFTNYRISSNAPDCLTGGAGVVASGTSLETSTNDEPTTWTAAAALTDGGVYYWCAQNDDGVLQSDWIAQGSFTLYDTLTIISGNNQLGGIEEELTDELRVRVSDGGTTYPGAGEVTVTFTITTIPNTPSAENQVLLDGTSGQNWIGSGTTTMTVETDASGYAGVKLNLGDRAGDYIVAASFGDGTGDKTQNFTATEREVFEFELSNTYLNMSIDPAINSVASDSVILSVTTNASGFQVTLEPDEWPGNIENPDYIPNWSGTQGFAWDNNNSGTSGGVTDPTPFSALTIPTDAYICSGTTCQGINNFTLDFHSFVDYTVSAGTYVNNVLVDSSNITF
jgi:hypothetical protein